MTKSDWKEHMLKQPTDPLVMQAQADWYGDQDNLRAQRTCLMLAEFWAWVEEHHYCPCEFKYANPEFAWVRDDPESMGRFRKVIKRTRPGICVLPTRVFYAVKKLCRIDEQDHNRAPFDRLHAIWVPHKSFAYTYLFLAFCALEIENLFTEDEG